VTTFLHGVETIEVNQAGVVVQGVKSSVVGLIGTAPVHLVAAEQRTVNEDVLCLSDVDDVRRFGPVLPGYTIPAELERLRQEGAKWVVVVNVFDPAEHTDDFAAADLAIEDGEIVLADKGLISVVVKVAGGAGAALVAGTDYSVDMAEGVITVLPGGALDGDEEANVTYVFGDPSAVVAVDVIGTVNEAGERTGAQALRNSFTKRGFHPKILLAPAYSTQLTVVNALRALAAWDRLRAIVAVDAPVGTTVEEAIEGRGPAGTINFNVSDDRCVLCVPHVKALDRTTGELGLAALSSIYAGVLAFTDSTMGFWVSPSNKQSRVIAGLEYPITAALNDKTCDVSLLNEVGITTVFNAFGTGYRVWGNRSSAFPATPGVKSFITQRRIADQIHESLELAMLPAIDLPITSPLIEDILQAANNYMGVLIGRGAVPAGSRVEFQAAKNPADQIALGKLTFTLVFVGSPPLEGITFESVVDTSLLRSLLPAAA